MTLAQANILLKVHAVRGELTGIEQAMVEVIKNLQERVEHLEVCPIHSVQIDMAAAADDIRAAERRLDRLEKDLNE